MQPLGILGSPPYLTVMCDSLLRENWCGRPFLHVAASARDRASARPTRGAEGILLQRRLGWPAPRAPACASRAADAASHDSKYYSRCRVRGVRGAGSRRARRFC